MFGMRKGWEIAFTLLLIAVFAIGAAQGATVTYTKNITLKSEVQDFVKDQQIFFDTPEYVSNKFVQNIDRGGAGGMANFEMGYSSQEKFFSLVKVKSNVLDTMMCDDEIVSQWNFNVGTIPYGFKRTFYAFNFSNPGVIVVYSELYLFPEFNQGITCEVVGINTTTLTYRYQVEEGTSFGNLF